MTRSTDMSSSASQRKRNANQPRPNAAPQPSSNSATPQKKNNKSQNSSQSQAAAKASAAASKPASSPVPHDEVHVPLKGFNAAEVDELLNNGIDVQAELYKSDKPSMQKTGPWAPKPGTTSTGKDFWLELRKQVNLLQRGESNNKGG